MKILTPKEFKSHNPEAYLDDYIAYLEKMQTDAEETLNNAKTFSMNDSIIESIKRQAEEIFNMALLVEQYMGQIILKTVEKDEKVGTFSLEELQSYFDFDEENRISDAKKDKLETERKEIENRLAEIERQIANNLYQNGRVKDFYEREDVENFFSNNEDPYTCIEKLLGNLSSAESTFESIASELSEQLTVALETECRIQGITLSPDDISKLCTKIMDLFRKIVNILKYSKDAKDQLVKLVLSESGIKQFLPDNFDENTPTYLMIDLMNLEKFKTVFYLNLPSSLKERLENTRLQGEPYDSLLQTYRAFLASEELPSDDLNHEEKDEKRRLEGELEKVNYDLAVLSTERDSRQEFLGNEEKMRSVLRERILGMIETQVTAEDIDSIIGDEEKRLERLKTELSQASKLLPKKVNSIKKAKSILLSPSYHDFFQAVEFNNDRSLHKAYGFVVTADFILPFLDAEKRRYEQLEIMIDLQDKLDSIHTQIETQKKKANFVTKRLTSYKEKLRTLDEQYQKEVEAGFESLKKKDLFYVNAPRIAAQSTVGNIIILPPEEEQRVPADFSEVSGLKQILWNMPAGIDENTKKRFLAADSRFDSWEDYYQALTHEHATLVDTLFEFGKTGEGYYIFSTFAEERVTLKELQTEIIEILSSVYEERKSVDERFGEEPIQLDSDKVSELRALLGDAPNLSRESLAVFIKKTEEEVAELKRLFADNYTLCSNLGIAIPQNITPSVASNDDDDELQERIRSLNIDGVTNLEEAVAHRDLLSGLEQYTVPTDKIKRFYLDHKNK